MLSPMMTQYMETKEKYKDYILMFRLGDFYEMFFNDAKIASKELELVLTGRDCGLEERAPMCGVPFHKADVYISRLVEKGYKVAICEQMEDPATAKGIVRREVVKVVTPGTVLDSTVLPDFKNNYLCALSFSQDSVGFACADIANCRVNATYFEGEGAISRLFAELSCYAPSEVISNLSREDTPKVVAFLEERFPDITINFNEGFRYDVIKATALATAAFGRDKVKEIEAVSPALTAIGALISYVLDTQKTEDVYLNDLNFYLDGRYLKMDSNTVRNLELTETLRNKDKKGSLISVIDKTRTAMGARELRFRILHPLVSIAEITRRLDSVEAVYRDFMVKEQLKEALSGIQDIERLFAKVMYNSANAKDLTGIANSLSALPALKEVISSLKNDEFSEMYQNYDDLSDITSLIYDSINPNAPTTLRDGDLIAPGYNSDVDYLKNIKTNSQGWLKDIEEKEKELTGIKLLKVSYNKVFGYYIEVTNSQKDLVPERYIRKQTLVGSERYITEELKEIESTLLGAADKLAALEYNLFCEIRDRVKQAADRILKAANVIARIDVYYSLAEVARKNNYTRPDVDLSDDIIIKDGRHPVVESFVSESYFVPNDTVLSASGKKLMLITGPNMAGKSTYMRQVALITLLAQCGAYVPAKEARIGVCDALFTRVGASDDLASGQSTFMLEMNEVAYILTNATKHSLIIYDEIGRGTSTYDGMSIARAVAEYTVSSKIGARSLFATHYHELTDLEEKFPSIVNYHIAAKKRGENITFLRKIVPGATDDSFGIEVAKLAGVPSEVTRRAKAILSEIESEDPKEERKIKVKNSDDIMTVFDTIEEDKNSEIAERLQKTDINTITPLEAMNLIYELKRMLS